MALRTTNCVKSSEAALIVGGVGAAFFVGFGEGCEPQFGARPLKGAIQRLIQDPLAMKILDGEVLPGDTVEVGADLK